MPNGNSSGKTGSETYNDFDDIEDRVSADAEHGPGLHYKPRKTGSTKRVSEDPEDGVAASVLAPKGIRRIRTWPTT